MERELSKPNSRKALENYVSKAKSSIPESPRIPPIRMGQALQQTIELNRKIRNYFGNNVGNLTYITSKPDFVKFLNSRGPKRNGETLNSVRRQYLKNHFNKFFS